MARGVVAPMKKGRLRCSSYALIQERDVKTIALEAEAAALGATLVPARGRAYWLPIRILQETVVRGRPRAVVFRYLNDYRSLLQTGVRLGAELVSILLAWLLGARIVWICHNVDRETTSHHPSLSRFRRHLMSRVAERILVTDPLLVPHAQRTFPAAARKISYITFGAQVEKGHGERSRELTQQVRRFLQPEAARGRNPTVPEPGAGAQKGSASPDASAELPKRLVGLCAGRASWKTAHFEQLPLLLDKAEALDVELRMIVVGPIGRYLDRTRPDILQFLREDPRILFVDEFIHLDETALAPYVDFYWRAYRDLSVPFTLYHAAALKKPVLAQGPGFVAEMVAAYGLGAVVAEDFHDLAEALDRLQRWDSSQADAFLKSHSWTVGAARLIEACGLPVAGVPGTPQPGCEEV